MEDRERLEARRCETRVWRETSGWLSEWDWELDGEREVWLRLVDSSGEVDILESYYSSFVRLMLKAADGTCKSMGTFLIEIPTGGINIRDHSVWPFVTRLCPSLKLRSSKIVVG
jgi:hypothetical protein